MFETDVVVPEAMRLRRAIVELERNIEWHPSRYSDDTRHLVTLTRDAVYSDGPKISAFSFQCVAAIEREFLETGDPRDVEEYYSVIGY